MVERIKMIKYQQTLLVGGWTNPSEKYYIVKLDHFPKVRGEILKKIWNHQPA